MADRCTVCFTYRNGVEIHWMWSCFPLDTERRFFVARWVWPEVVDVAGVVDLRGAVERAVLYVACLVFLANHTQKVGCHKACKAFL